MSQVVTGPARAGAPATLCPAVTACWVTWTGPVMSSPGWGPNWFASVMGTGIVATAAADLPVQWQGLRGFAVAVWVLSAMWLITLAGAEVVLWTRHRDAARGHARDPVTVQFYGAPPMALLTVGAGALLLGPALVGARAAIAIDAVLWPENPYPAALEDCYAALRWAAGSAGREHGFDDARIGVLAHQFPGTAIGERMINDRMQAIRRLL